MLLASVTPGRMTGNLPGEFHGLTKGAAVRSTVSPCFTGDRQESLETDPPPRCQECNRVPARPGPPDPLSSRQDNKGGVVLAETGRNQRWQPMR